MESSLPGGHDAARWLRPTARIARRLRSSSSSPIAMANAAISIHVDADSGAVPKAAFPGDV